MCFHITGTGIRYKFCEYPFPLLKSPSSVLKNTGYYLKEKALSHSRTMKWLMQNDIFILVLAIMKKVEMNKLL